MTSTDVNSQASSPESEAAGIRALLRQHQFSESLAAGKAVLSRSPDNRDVLLYVAISQRYLGLINESLATLETLQSLHPHFSRLHEERGRCFVELKQAPQAIAAFRQAVNLNHALPGVWGMLEGLYRMAGRADLAAAAADELAVLKSLPVEVVTATGLYVDEDLDAAEALVRSYLLKHGDQVEGMRLLARIGVARQVFEDAEILLAAALDLEPDHQLARQEYAAVLVELHKYQEARRVIEPLLEHMSYGAPLKMLYATCIVGLGEYHRAIEIFRELLQGSPADENLHLWIAHALKTLGRRQEAIESYRRAASCRGDFGDAYWSLANLKTYRFTDDELARMCAADLASTTGFVDRYHLNFALGKAFEDRGEYAESFRFYLRGNSLKRAENRSRAEIFETNTRQQVDVCTSEFFAARLGWGTPTPDPIFIVGLPRSGSTLLEQILGSHSRIDATQELATIQQLVTRLRGRAPELTDTQYPHVLLRLRAEDCRQLGESYLQDTRIYRAGKPFFIDKMPNNFRHIGLIHLILPNARVIDARREPMACCFSNFKQLFARGQDFAYGFEEIARYYRTYLELMRHWDRVLPGRILRVQYEDVVDDLESNVRRILDFCGLDFEPQCVEFYRSERTVRTASSEQVRQPIYREGLDQWKNFEPWLGQLREGLGDALSRYRDE